MAISEPYELDGVSISTTEISIISGTSSLQTNTTAGIYHVMVDPVGAGVAKGDEFKLRVYEKVELTGGTKRLAFSQTISDAQSQVLYLPPFFLMNGWDMTLQKVAGTDRNFDASIRAVTGNSFSERNELDGVTVGSSELSVVSGTTSLQTISESGYYQLWVDANAMAKADIFDIRVYEKCEGTGGTKRELYKARLENVQSELFFTPTLLLKNGWDFTIQKVSGTDCAFDASLRRVAG